MKKVIFIVLILLPIFSFSQEEDWVKTEGEITEITAHSGKKLRSSAIVKFNLENGTEKLGSVEILRIPFIGGINSVGDTITIYYSRNNPAILETPFGKFLSNYGMYALILLGIIFSIKRLLKTRRIKM